MSEIRSYLLNGVELLHAGEAKAEIAKLKVLCSRANNYMRLMDGEEFELDQSFGTLKDELREAAK